MQERKRETVVDVRRYNGRCQVRTQVDSKGRLVVTVVDPEGRLTKRDVVVDNKP